MISEKTLQFDLNAHTLIDCLIKTPNLMWSEILRARVEKNTAFI